MNVVVLQHVSFEGVGNMQHWLDTHNAQVRYIKFYLPNAQLPEPTGIDLVIAMGGPMSVNNEDQYPWLIKEKQFLRDAINNNTAVLGVCLGAQLIASALGAAVKPNDHTEIGWFKIRGIDHESGAFRFPEEMPLFHWHGETFGIPEGATRLATSEACDNQAFQFGQNVIGMQFHPEMTKETVDDLLKLCADELVAGEFVQSVEAITSAPHQLYAEGHQLMDRILDYLVIAK